MITFGFKSEGTIYMERHGAYAVILENGKLATMQTSAGFFLPGGGVEPGETHEECLERELMEELGWSISIERFIGKAQQYYYSDAIARDMLSIAKFYVAKKLEGPNEAQEPHHKLVWLGPKEGIERLFHRHQAWAVEEVVEKR